MSRLKLFQQIGQGSQKFGTWYKEIYKQAKRCDWSAYNVETAARDAIMYQTSDQKLRKRILANNMSYDETVAWGQSHEESGRKALLVEETTNRSEDKVRRLEVKLGKLQAKQKAEARLALAPDTLKTKPVLVKNVQNAMHASRQDTSLVHLYAQAPASSPRQGLGRVSTRRRRSKLERWMQILRRAQPRRSQTPRVLAA